jgi:threonine dehydratase
VSSFRDDHTVTRYLDLDAIARAAREIDPVFRATPQYEADALGRRIGARVLLKVETVNPIRSFKGRGTDFFLRTLNPLPRRMVTASAGNFGQGLAWAARARGVILDVFAAESANLLKVTRMRELGATVRLAGRDFDDAKSHARVYAEREGLMFVEDGREPAIAEGAGSIAVELLSWPEPIAAALIPLGNGALLGGMGAWIRHASPGTRIIGVCAAGAPAMRDSLRLGRVVETSETTTIADGIAVRVPIPEALNYLAPVVDDVVLVSDDAMRQAMDLVLAGTGLVSEPAGVAGIAALIEHADLRAGGLVASPLCGSNAPAV